MKIKRANTVQCPLSFVHQVIVFFSFLYGFTKDIITDIKCFITMFYQLFMKIWRFPEKVTAKFIKKSKLLTVCCVHFSCINNVDRCLSIPFAEFLCGHQFMHSGCLMSKTIQKINNIPMVFLYAPYFLQHVMFSSV